MNNSHIPNQFSSKVHKYTQTTTYLLVTLLQACACSWSPCRSWRPPSASPWHPRPGPPSSPSPGPRSLGSSPSRPSQSAKAGRISSLALKPFINTKGLLLGRLLRRGRRSADERLNIVSEDDADIVSQIARNEVSDSRQQTRKSSVVREMFFEI